MEMAVKQAQYPAVLDSYAKQGRFFLSSAASSFVQFGRVLTEAKPLVPHGQWESWVRDSFGMSSRTAQGYMAAWDKFGSDPQLVNVQYTKLREMLALPEGTQEKFLEDNNVAEMTSREVKEAVKKVREELQGDIERERKARIAAEKRCEEIANLPSEADEELLKTLSEQQKEIELQKGEMLRLQEIASESIKSRNDAMRKLTEAQNELAENDEFMKEQQQEYNRMQAELLNAKSMIAKGDAERVISERMSAEEFAGAVRAFMGAVSQMPYMGGAFATMTGEEKDLFDQYLSTVEGWAKNARKALDTMSGEVYEL